MIGEPGAIFPDYIQEWADKIKRLRLTQPALLLLEAHKPLVFITSQFIIVGQPLLNLFLPLTFTQNTVNLLSHPVYVEQLMRELERN
jgi:hypothetical protein